MSARRERTAKDDYRQHPSKKDSGRWHRPEIEEEETRSLKSRAQDTRYSGKLPRELDQRRGTRARKARAQDTRRDIGEH